MCQHSFQRREVGPHSVVEIVHPLLANFACKARPCKFPSQLEDSAELFDRQTPGITIGGKSRDSQRKLIVLIIWLPYQRFGLASYLGRDVGSDTPLGALRLRTHVRMPIADRGR